MNNITKISTRGLSTNASGSLRRRVRKKTKLYGGVAVYGSIVLAVVLTVLGVGLEFVLQPRYILEIWVALYVSIMLSLFHMFEVTDELPPAALKDSEFD